MHGRSKAVRAQLVDHALYAAMPLDETVDDRRHLCADDAAEHSVEKTHATFFPSSHRSRGIALCALLSSDVVLPDFLVLCNHRAYPSKRRLRCTERLELVQSIGSVARAAIDVQVGQGYIAITQSGRETKVSFEEIKAVDIIDAVKERKIGERHLEDAF